MNFVKIPNYLKEHHFMLVLLIIYILKILDKKIPILDPKNSIQPTSPKKLKKTIINLLKNMNKIEMIFEFKIRREKNKIMKEKK
jgi:hypothetical protein